MQRIHSILGIFKADLHEIDAVIESNKDFPAQYDTILLLGIILFLSK